MSASAEGHLSLPSRARRVLYDAWVFFTLLLLLVAVVTLLWPVRAVDRLCGSQLVAPLVRLVECIANL